MKFEYGMLVEYRGTHGWISFIDDGYITVCFLDIPDKTKHNGRYQANLLVFREHWNEVRCCVDQTKEEQEGETTSYFLQSRGCDLVGAAC
jgi:hypothetical protein